MSNIPTSISTPILPSHTKPQSSTTSTSTPTSKQPQQPSSPQTYVHYQNYSTPQPKNYHPYLIQSTSSSLLTRSNSSPSHPVEQIKHRSSRSMSSLSSQTFQGVGSESEQDETTDNRRRSFEITNGTPSKHPGIKRSGTLPSFPSPSVSTPTKNEVDLPTNPKLWTPSELAVYLGWMLRSGGHDGLGQILPAPVVEDIKSWVLRHQVGGRAFLKGGGDAWDTSRPPPFLPLLQSISRRLRRSSLQGRVSMTLHDPSLPPIASETDDLARTSSVLFEEEEVLSDDEEISGVRRMAHAFDTRGSASETSGDEGLSLRAQLTGERGVGLKRNNTGGSSRDMEVTKPDTDETKPDAKTKEVPSSETETSPPPPYTSPNPKPQSPSSPLLPPSNPVDLVSTPTRLTPHGLGISTPKTDNDLTPSKPTHNTKPGSPHMSNMETHLSSGRNPYAALCRSSSSKSDALPTLSSLRQAQAQTQTQTQTQKDSSEDEDQQLPSGGAGVWDRDDLEQSRWTTARRVTLRPSHANSVFPEGGTASSSSSRKGSMRSKAKPSKREKEMETQLQILEDRIKELENKLSSASSEDVEAMVIPPSRPKSPMLAMFPDSILVPLGLGGFDNEPLPRRIRELPGYLFLVGVGVGAVMVRVLFSRTKR